MLTVKKRQLLLEQLLLMEIKLFICQLLDITIFDANGNEIVKDAKTDNLPDVTFTPKSTGTYTIKVLAYSTSDSGFVNWVVLTNIAKSQNLFVGSFADKTGLRLP